MKVTLTIYLFIIIIDWSPSEATPTVLLDFDDIEGEVPETTPSFETEPRPKKKEKQQATAETTKKVRLWVWSDLLTAPTN